MMSRLRWSAVSLVALCTLVGSATPAHAVEITGRFNFALGNVKVTLGNVDWTTDPGTTLNPPPNATASYGGFDISTGAATRTGVFSGSEFDSTGLGNAGSFPCPTNPLCAPESIRDISDPSGPYAGDANNFPVGVTTSVVNFFKIAEHPTWNFTGTYINPGTAGLPFQISQNGSNVDTSITINGIAWDTATPTLVSRWTAIISAQYTNVTLAQLEAQVIAGTLPINSWSGTFEATAVPEPATLLTFGLGTLVMAGVARRRRAKK